MTHPAPLPSPPTASRASDDETLRLRATLASRCDLTLLETVPAMTLLVDTRRRAVHANAALLAYLGDPDRPLPLAQVLGLRPGELFRCVHATEEPGGCGTTRSCVQCGLLQALAGAAAGTVVEGEGRMLRRHGGRLAAVTIATRAVALDLGGERAFLLYLQDARDRRAGEVMERLFLHDALNALNGILGAAGMLREEADGDLRELAGMILERSGYLERELRAYRMLLDAERAELELTPQDTDPQAICAALVRLFELQARVAGVALRCVPGPEHSLQTDKGILFRVLENLVKNAVEASPQGGTVTVGHEDLGSRVRFFVTNEAVMPPEIQTQVFQRFFSTKGPGRGLGTYGVRLLTENCLRGEVALVSAPGQGTVFQVLLPRVLDADAPDAAPAETP